MKHSLMFDILVQETSLHNRPSQTLSSMLFIALSYLLHVKGTFYLAPCYNRLSLLQTLNNVPKHLCPFFTSYFHFLIPVLVTCNFFPSILILTIESGVVKGFYNKGGGGWNCWVAETIDNRACPQNTELKPNLKLLHQKH